MKNATGTTSQRRWRYGHRAFFVYMQLLIVALKRFDTSVRATDLNRAERSLNAAASACWGAAWLLTYTGGFMKSEYDTEIVPTMKPPEMSIAGFSGLLSLDHNHLVRLVKKLRPTLAALPSRLKPAFRDLIRAYDAMMEAHINVCDRQGGGERPSLRMDQESDHSSTESLAHLKLVRLDAMKPKGDGSAGCPFHHS